MEAKYKAVFYPRTMGVFILLIIVLSFAAGTIRKEMALTLTGAVFLALWSYCLFMTLLLALLNAKRAGRIFIRLNPHRIVNGEWTYVNYIENSDITAKGSAAKKIFQLPGILLRCRVLLQTKDHRLVSYDFKPVNKTDPGFPETFRVKKRGAYYSAYDELAIFDILGLFRFAYRVPVAGEGAARLLVSPLSAEEAIPARAEGGESNRQDSLTLERTDYLIDHRPYVPGDDPRRINWKLYGHSDELIIRQGEREPPPCSNITILIDTQYDLLYPDKSSARRAVDTLCENALAIINNIDKETDIQIGYTGQAKTAPEEPLFDLAYPAAVYEDAELPPVPEERGIILLALPRAFVSHGGTGGAETRSRFFGIRDSRRDAETRREDSGMALETFLSRNPNRSIELLFIYEERDSRINSELREAARACAAHYNRRAGVKSQAIEVGK
jgi:hypothetical protein